MERLGRVFVTATTALSFFHSHDATRKSNMGWLHFLEDFSLVAFSGTAALVTKPNKIWVLQSDSEVALCVVPFVVPTTQETFCCS